MNTRKANLRKLRLPSTETKNGLRNGHRKPATTISKFFCTDPDNILEEVDRKDKDATMACSEPMPSSIYYSPPLPSPTDKPEEEVQEKITRSTRTKLKTFIPKDKRMKPAADNPLTDFLKITNDFESPPGKNIKVAPKIKEKAKPKPKPKSKAKPKKQQTIKSAFFQNEELFSDVAAQHCLVDNVNPDEMQLALALSRSEVELTGSPAEGKSTGNNEGIRDKLKQFGFQVAESEADAGIDLDENDSEGEILPEAIKYSSNEDNIMHEIDPQLQSPVIKRIRAESPVDFVLLSNKDKSSNDAIEYSPPSLPSTISVPGADGSPMTKTPYKSSSAADAGIYLHENDSQSELLAEATKFSSKEDNIMHEIDSHLQSPAIKRVRAESPVDFVLLSNTETSSNDAIEYSQPSLPSTISSVPYDSKQRRRKTPSILGIQNTPIDSVTCFNYCEKELSFNFDEEPLKQFNTTLIDEITSATSTCTNDNEIESQIQIKTIRSTSPDIFADSDVEMETDDGSDMEKLKFTSSEDHIETYEIFSSDGVKTSSDSKVDSCDKNHNSLIVTVDLTQQGSETSSQNSATLIPTAESLQPYQDPNDLPSTSFDSQLNEQTLIRTKSFKEPNSSLENSILLEKSTEIKRINGFSFGSTASDDFSKSTSFSKETKENSIDLTQNDDDEHESIDCIVLSDDEVNYSIRKADKSLHLKDEKSSTDKSFESTDSKDNREFSFVDFVGATQPLPPTQSEEFELSFTKTPNKSVNSLDMDLSKRSDFGILEEQSPFKTPTRTPKKTPRKTPRSTPTKSPKTPKSTTPKCRRALSESFLGSPLEPSSAPLKRFSSSNKFKEFTKNVDESFSDLDDIDKLIYGSPEKKIYKKPTGLTQLLTGVINEKIKTPEKVKDKEVPQEFDFNGRTYLVRTIDVTRRPNFATMDESELLDRLYRYGIKPLKRKQAEKILEYIYNQTHPRLVDEADIPSTGGSDCDINVASRGVGNESDTADDVEMSEDIVSSLAGSKFNLKDCWGHILVSDTIPSIEIKDEQYFFQTNSSKKISTAQLPLHIAWYNLLKSNTQLHEAILYYEPIDLQEVYLFLKSLGYRYDPKDIKYFFDSRSIIFRYDVKKSESTATNRHVRKKRQKVKK
ncbi:structure-specific endonuclease subunit SLX4 isoform X2 [Episyrphus balteatus]|uniref:structure-specific endonuclease subunit SLX4 isoform X2 n=1 Tax=Episyrphus balteatus TaxID=286459 RepID=UPI00248551F9|nr:structure-specific endonuclease subunit SLX4 isoform X2 [Episyrphus balteatus]